MRLAAALLLVLAACQPIQHSRPLPPPEGPSILVKVGTTGPAARQFLHNVAASCWLDGVVRGANMIVAPDGTIEIVGDYDLLVAAHFVRREGAASIWRLSGQSIGDPARRAKLVETLDRAVRTGQTRCPLLL